jgi:hypothetical protein
MCQMSKLDVLQASRFLRTGIRGGIPVATLLAIYEESCHEAIWEEYQKLLLDVIPNPGPSVLRDVRRRAVWNDKFNSADGKYWTQLHTYLSEVSGRGESELASLDQASDEILFNLGDPNEEGDKLEAVMGLVVGHVQSGKTANYTALTAKAFDAGYKIVIVLTGIHNALRRQTQIRLDNELGIVASTPLRPTASILGKEDPDSIVAMTSEDLTAGDFRYSTGQNNLLNNGRFLFVTKKNKSVLARLNEFLGESVKYPILIIDDEADQASVNTGGNRVTYDVYEGDDAPPTPEDDFNPTKINEEIRRLVKKCKNVSYVGYTATPYANVFIPHDADDRVVQSDLYPRDFIVSLQKPKGYFGPEEFFGTDVTGEEGQSPSIADRVIQIVNDNDVEQLSSLENPISDEDPILPVSLKEAIADFLMGTAFRRLREEAAKPSSLLVHASHLSQWQKALAKTIEQYLSKLRNNWRYDNESAESYWSQEWARFCESMSDSDTAPTFSELKDSLEQLLGRFSPLPVLLLNHLSEDELDYEATPELTAIVVGGNKLSRGLTLEGLIVSYFVRSTKAPKADTLTQMGRFFGYKSDLIDLTRIYTTDQLREDFVEVALMEASLRREIHRYSLSGKTPSDFAPRVLKRSRLMPTARNKMTAAKAFGISYSGDLVQTTSFPKWAEKAKIRGGNSKLSTNESSTNAFVAKLRDVSSPEENESKTRILWRNVAASEVTAYLEEYQVIDGATRFVPSNICSYISDLNKAESPELRKWDVAIVGRAEDSRLGHHEFAPRVGMGRIERSLVNGSDVSIGTLVNPLEFSKGTGDELLGMLDSEIESAKELRESDSKFSPSEALRTARDSDRGLLIIYPISGASIGSSKGKRSDKTVGQSLEIPEDTDSTIIGLSIIFPFSNDDQSSREYWVGTAGRQDDGE